MLVRTALELRFDHSSCNKEQPVKPTSFDSYHRVLAYQSQNHCITLGKNLALMGFILRPHLA
jgi:hypothetical protein